MQYASTVLHIFSVAFVFHNVNGFLAGRSTGDSEPPASKPSLSCVLFYGDGLCIFKCRLFGQGAEGHCDNKTCTCKHGDTTYIEGENGFEVKRTPKPVSTSSYSVGKRSSPAPEMENKGSLWEYAPKEWAQKFTPEENKLKLKLVTLLVFLQRTGQDICQFLRDNNVDVDEIRRLSEKEKRQKGKVHSRSMYSRNVPSDSDSISKQSENIGTRVYNLIPDTCEKKYSPRYKKLAQKQLKPWKPRHFDRSRGGEGHINGFSDNDDATDGSTNLNLKSLPSKKQYQNQKKRQFTINAHSSPTHSLRLLSPSHKKANVRHSTTPPKKKRVPEKPGRYSFTYPLSSNKYSPNNSIHRQNRKNEQSKFTPLPDYTVQPAMAEILPAEPIKTKAESNHRPDVSEKSTPHKIQENTGESMRQNADSKESNPKQNQIDKSLVAPSNVSYYKSKSDVHRNTPKNQMHELLGMNGVHEGSNIPNSVKGTESLGNSLGNEVSMPTSESTAEHEVIETPKTNAPSKENVVPNTKVETEDQQAVKPEEASISSEATPVRKEKEEDKGNLTDSTDTFEGTDPAKQASEDVPVPRDEERLGEFNDDDHSHSEPKSKSGHESNKNHESSGPQSLSTNIPTSEVEASMNSEPTKYPEEKKVNAAKDNSTPSDIADGTDNTKEEHKTDNIIPLDNKVSPKLEGKEEEKGNPPESKDSSEGKEPTAPEPKDVHVPAKEGKQVLGEFNDGDHFNSEPETKSPDESNHTKDTTGPQASKSNIHLSQVEASRTAETTKNPDEKTVTDAKNIDSPSETKAGIDNAKEEPKSIETISAESKKTQLPEGKNKEKGNPTESKDSSESKAPAKPASEDVPLPEDEESLREFNEDDHSKSEPTSGSPNESDHTEEPSVPQALKTNVPPSQVQASPTAEPKTNPDEETVAGKQDITSLPDTATGIVNTKEEPESQETIPPESVATQLPEGRNEEKGNPMESKDSSESKDPAIPASEDVPLTEDGEVLGEFNDDDHSNSERSGPQTSKTNIPPSPVEASETAEPTKNSGEKTVTEKQDITSLPETAAGIGNATQEPMADLPVPPESVATQLPEGKNEGKGNPTESKDSSESEAPAKPASEDVPLPEDEEVLREFNDDDHSNSEPTSGSPNESDHTEEPSVPQASITNVPPSQVEASPTAEPKTNPDEETVAGKQDITSLPDTATGIVNTKEEPESQETIPPESVATQLPEGRNEEKGNPMESKDSFEGKEPTAPEPKDVPLTEDGEVLGEFNDDDHSNSERSGPQTSKTNIPPSPVEASQTAEPTMNSGEKTVTEKQDITSLPETAAGIGNATQEPMADLPVPPESVATQLPEGKNEGKGNPTESKDSSESEAPAKPASEDVPLPEDEEVLREFNDDDHSNSEPTSGSPNESDHTEEPSVPQASITNVPPSQVEASPTAEPKTNPDEETVAGKQDITSLPDTATGIVNTKEEPESQETIPPESVATQLPEGRNEEKGNPMVSKDSFEGKEPTAPEPKDVPLTEDGEVLGEFNDDDHSNSERSGPQTSKTSIPPSPVEASQTAEPKKNSGEKPVTEKQDITSLPETAAGIGNATQEPMADLPVPPESVATQLPEGRNEEKGNPTESKDSSESKAPAKPASEDVPLPEDEESLREFNDDDHSKSEPTSGSPNESDHTEEPSVPQASITNVPPSQVEASPTAEPKTNPDEETGAGKQDITSLPDTATGIVNTKEEPESQETIPPESVATQLPEGRNEEKGNPMESKVSSESKDPAIPASEDVPVPDDENEEVLEQFEHDEDNSILEPEPISPHDAKQTRSLSDSESAGTNALPSLVDTSQTSLPTKKPVEKRETEAQVKIIPSDTVQMNDLAKEKPKSDEAILQESNVAPKLEGSFETHGNPTESKFPTEGKDSSTPASEDVPIPGDVDEDEQVLEEYDNDDHSHSDAMPKSLDEPFESKVNPQNNLTVLKHSERVGENSMVPKTLNNLEAREKTSESGPYIRSDLVPAHNDPKESLKLQEKSPFENDGMPMSVRIENGVSATPETPKPADKIEIGDPKKTNYSEEDDTEETLAEYEADDLSDDDYFSKVPEADFVEDITLKPTLSNTASPSASSTKEDITNPKTHAKIVNKGEVDPTISNEMTPIQSKNVSNEIKGGSETPGVPTSDNATTSTEQEIPNPDDNEDVLAEYEDDDNPDDPDIHQYRRDIPSTNSKSDINIESVEPLVHTGLKKQDSSTPTPQDNRMASVSKPETPEHFTQKLKSGSSESLEKESTLENEQSPKSEKEDLHNQHKETVLDEFIDDEEPSEEFIEDKINPDSESPDIEIIKDYIIDEELPDNKDTSIIGN